MKKILFSQPGFLKGELFSPKYEYTLTDPFVYLKKKLYKYGYQVATIDEYPLKSADKIIFMDYHSVLNDGVETEYYEKCLKLSLREKTVLFLHESKAIFPQNYSSDLHSRFDTILTWDDDLVDNQKFFKMYHAYQRHKTPIVNVPYDKKKLITSMSINKNSNVSGELYSTRRRTIEYFDKHFPKDFEFYGDNWNQPLNRIERWIPFLRKKYSTYRGKAGKYDKEKVLSNYKFTICYENIGTVNGYITEKIFDCLWAGTVPIYLGAPNIADYVDPKAFIDRRKFKSEFELAKYLTGMTRGEYLSYLKASVTYLKSESFKKFLPPEFARKFISILKLKQE